MKICKKKTLKQNSISYQNDIYTYMQMAFYEMETK